MSEILLKRRKYIAILGLVLFPLILVIPVVINFPVEQKDKLFPIIFGLYAYSWMLINIIVGTKPKFLDKLIGLPDTYFMHSIVAIGIFVVMNLHKVFLTASGLGGFLGESGSFIFTVIIVVSLIYYTQWLVNKLTFLEPVKDWLKEHIGHEFSVWLHRLTLIATLLIFGHISMMSFVVNIPYFYPILITSLP